MNITRMKVTNIIVKNCGKKFGVQLTSNYDEARMEWTDWRGGWHMFASKEKALAWAEMHAYYSRYENRVTNLVDMTHN